MVRPFGMLWRIPSDSIKARDPNIVLLEVTGLTGCSLVVARISRHKGIFNVRMTMRLPPSPPQSVHPHRDMTSTEGRGRGMKQTTMSRLIEEEKRVQIVHDFGNAVIWSHGRANVRRTGLWRELTKVVATFQGSHMLMGNDFNVTLEAMDRPTNAGVQDLDLEDFRSFITEVMLQEMGPVNCVYTWKSTNRNTMPS